MALWPVGCWHAGFFEVYINYAWKENKCAWDCVWPFRTYPFSGEHYLQVYFTIKI